MLTPRLAQEGGAGAGEHQRPAGLVSFAPPGDPVPDGRLGSVKRPVKVDPEHPAPLVERHFGEARRSPADARVDEARIDPAELGDGFGIAAWTASWSPTSQITAWTRPPWRLSCWEAASFLSGLVPQMATAAPHWARPSAYPRPMPLLPPVISPT